VPVSQRENQTQRGPPAPDRRGRSVQDSPALFSSTKTTKVRSFRVRFDLNLTLRVILNFRDTEFVHRKDLQNLEFVDVRLFLVCLDKLA
jgi:hypothetical protein